jgi:hypothetical protein
LREKTGLYAQVFRFLGVLSGPELYYKYPHGDEVYNVIHVFQADGTYGALQLDEEGIDLQYFSVDTLCFLDLKTKRSYSCYNGIDKKPKEQRSNFLCVMKPLLLLIITWTN